MFVREPVLKPARPIARPASSLLQRKCDACTKEEEDLQRKPAARAAAPQGAARAPRSGGAPLEPGTRALMESRFGHDFSKVRIHADAGAAASARRVHALAYTLGEHIVFGAGQYRPGAAEGDRLIAHELAHVLQQTGGAPSSIQRQADDAQEEEAAADEGAEAEQDEDGAGVETDESSTEDDDLLAAEPEILPEEEAAPVQAKAAGAGAAAPELPHLEQEADRAAQDVLANRPVTVSLGAASSAPQRAPKKGAKAPKKPDVPKICDRPSTRVSDWPTTYIEQISVDLTSPKQEVTLKWTGPNAKSQPVGPFHGSPGAGCCDKDCDDKATSRTGESRCTPKGSWKVHGHSCAMTKYPEAKNVSWFSRDGVALHYYPSVPDWPASHGCVRLHRDASRIIYDNSVKDVTTVDVDGTWTRKAGVCFDCSKKKKDGAKKKKKK